MELLYEAIEYWGQLDSRLSASFKNLRLILVSNLSDSIKEAIQVRHIFPSAINFSACARKSDGLILLVVGSRALTVAPV